MCFTYAGTSSPFEAKSRWQGKDSTRSLLPGARGTYREEITHDPFEDSPQQQQDWPYEEKYAQYAAQTRGATPSHHDHGEAECRDDEANEAHRRWVGISLVCIPNMRDLGSKVELLKELGRQGDICGCLVERWLDAVRVVRHVVL